MFTPITTVKEIAAAFAKCSRAEREQIVGFTKANTEPPFATQPYGVWVLAVCRNQDTGRKFTTVALALSGEGIGPLEMRRIVGLPELKRAPKKKAPVKKALIKGGGRRVK